MNKDRLILEVSENLRTLADSLQGLVSAMVCKESTKETTSPQTSENMPSKQKEPTLEEVRHCLAKLVQGGKQAEVKGLITRYGADKLSDIPREKYPELLKEAGEIQ